MKLERHVGGLSRARKEAYLVRRGWARAEGDQWACSRLGLGPAPLKKAVHHQLTEDLSLSLVRSGWEVVGYSDRGYVRMRDGASGKACSLPAALRLQARREQRRVGELTYSLFLAVLLDSEKPA